MFKIVLTEVPLKVTLKKLCLKLFLKSVLNITYQKHMFFVQKGMFKNNNFKVTFLKDTFKTVFKTLFKGNFKHNFHKT